MNKKKTIINLLFLLTVFSLTMYLVFHGKDVNEILSAARTADKGYLFLSLFVWCCLFWESRLLFII